MTEAGMKKIEEARADGSWNALDASHRLKIEKDLAEAIARNAQAAANFEAFPAYVRRRILSWICSAKTAGTRAARIEKTVRTAARNLRANFDKEN